VRRPARLKDHFDRFLERDDEGFEKLADRSALISLEEKFLSPRRCGYRTALQQCPSPAAPIRFLAPVLSCRLFFYRNGGRDRRIKITARK
jgi:hypothetical protein